MQTLQRKIMRGIYYAYAIRLATLPGLWQGAVMFVILITLTRFVSLGNVLNNLTQIEMSHFGTFAYNAVRTTEAWTLLLIGLFVFCLLSFRVSIAPRGDAYTLGHTV